MTPTKRWIYLASSLAVAAGTGYGGYTQRHLILGQPDDGDSAVAEVAAADQSVQPIRVTAQGEEGHSPSSFQNPLRGNTFGDERVVRGNDEGAALPAPGNRFEPPPIQPPPSRSGGSASARVEVDEPSSESPAALTPPPTFPQEAAVGASKTNEQSVYGNRFAPPEADLTPPPAIAESAPSHRFSSGEAGNTSPRFDAPNEPTPAAPIAQAPLQPDSFAPPSRFGAPVENEQIVAASGANQVDLSTPRRFDSGDDPTAPPIGTGVNVANLNDGTALGGQSQLSGGTQIEGAGQPGAKELDGIQTPSIIVEKTAPPEIQIGKPAKFDIKVKNVGQATAENVAITDMVPQGTRLIDTTPQAASGNGGSVIWQLGTLRAGEEKSVSMQLMPVGEGEIGSVATVTFSAQASVRTKSTRPQLLVETNAPRQVLIGQPVKLTIRLSNPGTGAATHVVLEEDVPEGLTHPGGRALEFEAGSLKPGETRELELTLSATSAGVVQNVIRARADANLSVESKAAIEVIAPSLAIEIDGPSKRFLDRQATHELIISNPGTAPAKNIEMVAHLPKGLKFVGANNQGQYDTTSHAVFWSLEQLGPNDQGAVSLTTLPMEAGQQKIRVERACCRRGRCRRVVLRSRRRCRSDRSGRRDDLRGSRD
jgi:uncharacterized repeat protein (TIGR01451 family)